MQRWRKIPEYRADAWYTCDLLSFFWVVLKTVGLQHTDHCDIWECWLNHNADQKTTVMHNKNGDAAVYNNVIGTYNHKEHIKKSISAQY